MTRLASRIPATTVAAVILATLAFVAMSDHDRAVANHLPGMAAMSIDTNISGNDADTLGPNNQCVSAGAGSSITLDVTALSIPQSASMLSFGYGLTYDPAVFTVTAGDAHFLIGVAQGSSVLVGTEPPPDTDGIWDAGVIDINADAREWGSGVLERLTLAIDPGTNAGIYPLTLSHGAHFDINNHTYIPAAFRNAIVAIGQACPTGVGDVDCGDTVTSVDALKILRHNAGLSVSQPPACPDIGTNAGGGRLQGDVDCNGGVTAVDALKVLRSVAGLPAQQEAGCPPIS